MTVARHTVAADPRPDSRSDPTNRLLSAALVVAPVLSLAADATYAARGWDDATAGVLHVIGAIAFGFVILRVACWLGSDSRLAAWLLFVGVVGLAGNVAHGFDTIHLSYGDVQLVDRDGAASLIKPLGLFFPLSLVLVAAAVERLRHRLPAVLVVSAALLWPVAHIGNVAPLAVAANVLLVLAFGSLAVVTTRR